MKSQIKTSNLQNQTTISHIHSLSLFHHLFWNYSIWCFLFLLCNSQTWVNLLYNTMKIYTFGHLWNEIFAGKFFFFFLKTTLWICLVVQHFFWDPAASYCLRWDFPENQRKTSVYMFVSKVYLEMSSSAVMALGSGEYLGVVSGAGLTDWLPLM